ncbi:MAG: hypothetical protein VX871_12310 [Pseudomonadota bacterium]|nr:hypothetical protein [Pseudomonadota bacterium]
MPINKTSGLPAALAALQAQRPKATPQNAQALRSAFQPGSVAVRQASAARSDPATTSTIPALPAGAASVSEAARLFTRQSLSAYAALLAGEETQSIQGQRAVRQPATDGPPHPPGSVLDITA